MKKLLSVTHPELKQEWDSIANDNFRFEDAFTRSHRVNLSRTIHMAFGGFGRNCECPLSVEKYEGEISTR